MSKTGKRLIKAAKDAATVKTAQDAVASAWASIDGKIDLYRRGSTAKSEQAYGGYFAGYQEDAAELIKRVRARGYEVVPRWKPWSPRTGG